ncbi:MAG: InlB B-repeat-containing protein [Clostridiales bacterium]|nr:InlB B-repeat-containing protein [Clostridiales bacterium]
MKKKSRKIAIACLMALAMTVTALPVQLLSGIFRDSFVVNADGNDSSYVEISSDNETQIGVREYLPAYGYYKYGYSEQIYTADELGNADLDIVALSVKVTSAQYALKGDIYLCDTDKTSFADSSETIYIQDATLVYQGDMPFDQSGWVILGFNQSTFHHSKDKNLVVITVNKTMEWSNNRSAFAVCAGTENCSVADYTDNGELLPGSSGGHFQQDNMKNFIRFYSELSSYSLTYVANGGEGDDVVDTAYPDANLKVRNEIFTREGYGLACWNTQPDGGGTTYNPRDIITMNSDITLYAQWEVCDYVTVGKEQIQTNECPVIAFAQYSYSEQIYTAGEIGDLTSIGAISFDAMDAFRNPCSWSIYLLDTDKEWFDNKTDYVPLDDAVLVFDGTFTIDDAGWNKIVFDVPFYHNPQKNLVVITIDQSGISDDDVFFAFYQGQAKCTVFDYSYTYEVLPGISQDFKGTFDYKNVIRLHTSEEDAVTVTCKANGSGENDAIYAVASDTFTLKHNPFSYAGHTFTGWNTEADGSGDDYQDCATLSVTDDVVLYAQWDSVPTIWYNSNDGTYGRVAQTIDQENIVVLNNCFFNLHGSFQVKG